MPAASTWNMVRDTFLQPPRDQTPTQLPWCLRLSNLQKEPPSLRTLTPTLSNWTGVPHLYMSAVKFLTKHNSKSDLLPITRSGSYRLSRCIRPVCAIEFPQHLLHPPIPCLWLPPHQRIHSCERSISKIFPYWPPYFTTLRHGLPSLRLR